MASEHLRLMQRCGFLDVEKEGRRVYYTIAEPHLASIMACIEDRFGGQPKPRTNPRS
jgi:DNA-binding transcriptional ArsR family regulator